MALEHGQKRRWRKAENIPAHNVSRLYNPIYACSRKDSQVVVMLMTMVTMILIGLAPHPCYPDLRIQAGHEDAHASKWGKMATQV